MPQDGGPGGGGLCWGDASSLFEKLSVAPSPTAAGTQPAQRQAQKEDLHEKAPPLSALTQFAETRRLSYFEVSSWSRRACVRPSTRRESNSRTPEAVLGPIAHGSWKQHSCSNLRAPQCGRLRAAWWSRCAR